MPWGARLSPYRQDWPDYHARGPLAFAAALRTKLRKGDRTIARDPVRAVAQRVEVVIRKEVRVRGLRSELLRTLTAASGAEAAVLGVHAFELKWRTRHESDGHSDHWEILVNREH